MHADVRVRPFGDAALLIEPNAATDSWPGGIPRRGLPTRWVVVARQACLNLWPRATVVAGLASVLVEFDDPCPDADRAVVLLSEALARTPAWGMGQRPDDGAAAELTGIRTHTLPTTYAGEDLASVADAVGLTAAELVARHAAAMWTVAAVGFSPGFGYLVCEDPIFEAVRRRADPRRRVPAGAVAVAAGMCAVYPSASPGGWQLIGHTAESLFDPGSDDPVRLSVGDWVRFEPVL